MRTLPLILKPALIAFSVIFFGSVTGTAQVPPDPDPPGDDTSRIESMFIPSIGYVSDYGFLAGIGFNRYHLKDDYVPYYSLFDANFMASTRGLLLTRIQYNRTETFGRPIRSDFTLHGNRQLYSTFFGFGNETSFDRDLWDDNYYYYESLSFGVAYQGRIPMINNSRGRFDVLVHLGINYDTPRDVEEDRLLQEQQPFGYDGGFLNTLGTGIKWDSRDSELDPSEGFYARLDGELMSRLWFSDYDMQKISIEYSTYYTFPWLDDLRIAGRLGASQVFGDVPFWKNPPIGGEETLRGYPIERFRDKGRVFYNLELRKWLFEIRSVQLRFGAQAFTDGGRVIDFTSELDELFEGHYHTYGGGISYQIIDSNMMLRVEAGFSDEMWRMYVGTGFMF